MTSDVFIIGKSNIWTIIYFNILKAFLVLLPPIMLTRRTVSFTITKPTNDGDIFNETTEL